MGVFGYGKCLKGPTHPEYDEWLPNGFNPSHFSIKAVNEELERFGIWHTIFVRLGKEEDIHDIKGVLRKIGVMIGN